MEIDWSKTGFPVHHHEHVRAALKGAFFTCGVTGGMLLCGIVGLLFGFAPPLLTAILGAVFIYFGLITSLVEVYDTRRYVQIIPYFQRRIGGIDTFLAGRTMVRFLVQLDVIAIHQGVKPLSSFGFADDLLGEEIVWHQPAVGLETVDAVQAFVNHSNVPDTIVEPLLSDLAKWRVALERATAEQVLFCVLLRHGNSTSGHEWDLRQGSAF